MHEPFALLLPVYGGDNADYVRGTIFTR